MTAKHDHHAQSPSAIQRINRWMEHFSRLVTQWSGSSWAFGLAVLTIVVWVVTGPMFGFSDTWQLVINTGTTIVTFLMVFLIQRSQNKDAQAIQIKLDELLASQPGASNHLINVEDWSEDDINELHERFTTLSKQLEDIADSGGTHSIEESRKIVAAANELAGHARGALEQAKEDQDQRSVERDRRPKSSKRRVRKTRAR